MFVSETLSIAVSRFRWMQLTWRLILFLPDQLEIEKTKESIKRYETVDEITGKKREMIDLDNSVFMNFRRYTEKDVLNCFEADLRNSSFDLVNISEQDVSKLSSECNNPNYVFRSVSRVFSCFIKELHRLLHGVSRGSSYIKLLPAYWSLRCWQDPLPSRHVRGRTRYWTRRYCNKNGTRGWRPSRADTPQQRKIRWSVMFGGLGRKLANR